MLALEPFRILEQKPDLNRHPTLHSTVTCQMRMALQPNYISTLPVQLHTHFYSGSYHSFIWPSVDFYIHLKYKNAYFVIGTKLSTIFFLRWKWEIKIIPEAFEFINDLTNFLNIFVIRVQYLVLWSFSVCCAITSKIFLQKHNQHSDLECFWSCQWRRDEHLQHFRTDAPELRGRHVLLKEITASVCTRLIEAMTAQFQRGYT